METMLRYRNAGVARILLMYLSRRSCASLRLSFLNMEGSFLRWRDSTRIALARLLAGWRKIGRHGLMMIEPKFENSYGSAGITRLDVFSFAKRAGGRLWPHLHVST